MTAAQHEAEETSVTLTRLDGRVSVLETSISTLSAKMDGLMSMFNASRQTNWPSVIGVGSLLLGLIGGAWVIVDLKSQNALIPVLIQNAISSKEREELRHELTALVTIREQQAANIEKLREIETQFKKMGDAHNTQVAEQARMNAVLWNATGKLGEYPSGPYFFSTFSQHN